MSLSDSERQPLLISANGKPRKTPLPLVQVLIVCLVRLSEPIAYTQIFPYVNQMIEELGIASKSADIGFYSGLVDGIFAVAQLFTIYQWGKLSDRVGRRPVILSGLLGVAFATLVFGFSTSLPQMLLARALAGGLSGNTVIASSILSEITDKTNQAQVFALVGATWSIGSIVGPVIGGGLSHPVERYPNTFGSFRILKHFPFLLPCFASFLLTTTSIGIAYFFLNETLPSKVLPDKTAIANNLQHSESLPINHNSNTVPVVADTTAKRSLTTLLGDQRIRTVLSSTFLLAFVISAYEAVYVLFAYTRISLGGLSRSPSQIGYTLASTGIIGILNYILLFPSLHDRFGTRKVYILCMTAWPLIFTAMPLLNATVRSMMDRPQTSEVVITVGLAAISIIGRLGGMGYAVNNILVKSSAPDQQTLGATFGLAQTVGCLGRATGPAFVGSLFAISVDRQVLGGDLVWIIMVGVGCVGIWTAGLAGERGV